MTAGTPPPSDGKRRSYAEQVRDGLTERTVAKLTRALSALDPAVRSRVLEPYRLGAWERLDLETTVQNEHKLYADAMEQLTAARADSATRSAQVLMIASELCGDRKIDPADTSDPRWTPALQAASQLRSELTAARAEVERLKEALSIAVAEIGRNDG